MVSTDTTSMAWAAVAPCTHLRQLLCDQVLNTLSLQRFPTCQSALLGPATAAVPAGVHAPPLEAADVPHARYDSHRSAILRSGETHQAGGGSGAAAGGRPEDDVDPFQFFTPSCFSGYSDGSRCFYTLYSGVFSKLAAEEAQAREAEDSWRDDIVPAFGGPGLTAA